MKVEKIAPATEYNVLLELTVEEAQKLRTVAANIVIYSPNFPPGREVDRQFIVDLDACLFSELR